MSENAHGRTKLRTCVSVKDLRSTGCGVNMQPTVTEIGFILDLHSNSLAGGKRK